MTALEARLLLDLDEMRKERDALAEELRLSEKKLASQSDLQRRFREALADTRSCAEKCIKLRKERDEAQEALAKWNRGWLDRANGKGRLQLAQELVTAERNVQTWMDSYKFQVDSERAVRDVLYKFADDHCQCPLSSGPEGELVHENDCIQTALYDILERSPRNRTTIEDAKKEIADKLRELAKMRDAFQSIVDKHVIWPSICPREGYGKSSKCDCEVYAMGLGYMNDILAVADELWPQEPVDESDDDQ